MVEPVLGTRKAVNAMSDRPDEIRPLSAVMSGIQTKGMIVRVTHLPPANGMTGWTLSTFDVRLYGPSPKSVLFCSGMLIRSAIGFAAC